MISWEKAHEIVREDFEQFSGADAVMPYYKEKYFRMACNIIINTRCAEDASLKMLQMVKDTAHGLNHLFFQGFNAGYHYGKGEER